MKILFLCSCLEPGRDGVGDYTRRLAAEIIRQGHSAEIISLNDKYISDKLSNNQLCEGIELPVLRLPSSWAMKTRFKQAKDYVDNFDPDWLSLQFVIFGFNHKGLPFGLNNRLALLGAGRRWHIMFHELWVGMEIQSSKKHALLGRIQQLIIKSLISTLKPHIIHTHTELYQQKLKKWGYDAKSLPLFSNIPKIFNNDKKPDITQSFLTNSSVNLILFGNIHPNAPVEDFANDAAIFAAKNKIEIDLTIIGRCGKDQERWADKWAAAGLKVNVLGEQSIDNVSKLLGTATMGISTTPAALIGKSGSVAAMLEHGLPIICVPFPWQPRDFEDFAMPAGIMTYQKGNLESILSGRFDVPVANNISTITDQLIKLLNCA
jgi:hypothetical protein